MMTPMNNTELYIKLEDGVCTTNFEGNYDNLILALCGALQGIVSDMCRHPKYIEIQKKYELSDEEMRDNLLEEVTIKFLEKLTDIDVDIINSASLNALKTYHTNHDKSENIIDCDSFESIINDLSVDDEGES